MGIYVRGIKMPKSCWNCDMPLSVLKCPVQTEEEAMRYCSCRHKDCPIIPVPPHGRLIDADELKKIVANAKHMDAGIFGGKTMYSDHLCIGADYDDVCAAIDETRTIIPAEPSEEQIEYEAQVEAAQYCEMYEPSYDPETGAL